MRYSQVDLTDGNLLNAGGEVDNVAFALNWYPSPNTRVMWNFIHSELDESLYNGEDEDNALQMRIQIDF